MARRKWTAARPAVERCEIRLLPSGILAVMASASSAHGHYPISTTSIALPTNQGPQGTNLAIMPTGTPRLRRKSRAKKYATAENFFAVSLLEISHAAGSVSACGARAIFFGTVKNRRSGSLCR